MWLLFPACIRCLGDTKPIVIAWKRAPLKKRPLPSLPDLSVARDPSLHLLHDPSLFCLYVPVTHFSLCTPFHPTSLSLYCLTILFFVTLPLFSLSLPSPPPPLSLFLPGEKSSRDEQVACAMLATQLDNFLGGDPIQHRQIQGYEAPEFMNLFPRGVSYKDGGVESGFRRPQGGSGPVHRLYQIKGKRNIRAKEVELSWESFNKGDCFILDLGETIFSWIGSQANMFEKQKSREIASLIRDTERHGKARITDISEGEEPPEMLKVLGPMLELAESTPEEDSQADVSNSASLYKVSDATGKMKLTNVSEKSPFAKDLLVRDDCFILDNGANGKIFVWKGMGANAEEKREALKMADDFIQQMNYPRMKTQVSQA
uniref:Capping protein (actin filament), gelsolin-like b n=1 Tax=Oncorhynchus kisutch TaxID=8019 RepID=A0A8C7I504_ONCKI